MAEQSLEHPGFAWIMRNFDALMIDYPGQWVVADSEGYVTSSALQEDLLGELANRLALELAIVYMDPTVLRSPPDPTKPTPLSGAGDGGATFERLPGLAHASQS